MAYGSNKARAVRFQNNSGRLSPQTLIDRGLAAEEELYGGPGPSVQGPPEDMQMIQGVTDDIYKQWMSVKDFANTMWQNYRIDVTKPDTRNELAIKAHDLYNQAMGGLMYTGDALKQSNKQLGKYQEAFLAGHGYLQKDPQRNLAAFQAPEEMFLNTQLNPQAQQYNQYLAGGQETQAGTRSAEGKLNQARGTYDPRIEQAQAEGRPGMAANLQQDQSQFGHAFYDPKTWRPYAPKTGPSNTKMVYDQLTNYKIGLLNNDPGVIGTIKSNFPSILDIRPVNTGYKQGAYVTRKAGDKTVTSFISFGADDPTQGIEPLFYMLNDANPTKFQVNPNEFVPYMQQTTYEGMTPSQNAPEFDEMKMLFESFKSGGDVEKTLENGKNIVVTSDQKQEFVDRLDKLAVSGTLRMPNGESIVNVEIKDAKGFGWGSGGDLIMIDTKGEEEPILLDPNSPDDMRMFEQILEINSGSLISRERWDTGKTNYINSNKIQPDKGDNVNIDTQSQARSIVEQFEANKKKK